MDKLLTIAGKDIKEAFRSRTTYLYFLILIAVTTPYFGSMRTLMNSLVRQGLSPEQIGLASKSLLGGIASVLPIMLIMMVSGVFAAYVVILDKARRNLESLLATPVSLRQVWLGKSLAVAFPSAIIGLTFALAAIILMNIIVIMPVTGAFILPGIPAILTFFITIPVMTYFIIALVSLFQLMMTNPRIANFVFSAIFLGIYFSTISGVGISLDLSLIFLTVTLVLAVANIFASRFLTKEKVILSSKG